MIHKTAIISDGAEIHESVEIGPYAVIGAHVKVGKGSVIGPHAVLDGHTTIGEECKIFAGAAIGLAPQDFGYKDEPTGVRIGNRVTVREYATIHRATKNGVTVVGDDCYLMNYTHVAHDCKLGDGVILANNATLAGHVSIGDHTVIAGVCVIHQHCRIGRLVMISGLSGTRQDVPPFAMCDGRPLKVRGINVIGMRRKQFNQAARSAIKEAYRIIYRAELNLTQALARIASEANTLPETQEIIDFYKTSKRGVIGGTTKIEEESDD